MEEKIRTLEQKMKGIETVSKQREKECTLLLARSSSLEDNLNQRKRELKEQTELRLQVFLVSSPLLLFSSNMFLPLQGKSTTRRKKQESKREKTNLDEGGSSRERGHPKGKGR